MSGVNQIFLLIIFQGFYLGSVGQRWMFPKDVSALIGSCVEIPCTYDPDGTSGPASHVWYLYAPLSYPEILNTEDPSSVLKDYRDRTSLVPGQDCTLRIDPVRREDGGKYYYPGIIGNNHRNAYDNSAMCASLSVRDFTGKMDIWRIANGEVIIIQCSAEHTCGSSPPIIQWNKPGRVTQKTVDIYRGAWKEESTLTYIPTYEDDGSDVQCTATYPGGKQKKSGMLSVSYAPKNVIVTIIGKDEVMEGSDVTLQCNSVSNPDVYMYEWYKGKKKSRLQDTGREIIVRNVTGNMESYSCTAINTEGRGESALMDIPVLFAPKNVTVTVIGMDTVMEGSHVTLQCDSVSNFEVYEYEWYKGKEKSRLPDIGQKIRVKNITWDVEPYSCAAINRMGRGESDLMDIPVLYAPKNVIVTVVGKDEVMEGSDVTLQCNSVSNPDVYMYEWYKGEEKSRLQDTGPEIIVRNVTRNMESYSCAAVNRVGRGESALMEIQIPYEGFSISNIILPATIGTICLLLLILLVYCCWRKKNKKFPSKETKTLPDATYTDLLKRDDNIYEQVLVEDHKHA